MVAILLRGGAHALEVRTGARFSHRNRSDDFARNHLGQPLLLLLFRTILDDIVGNDISLQREAGGDIGVIAEFLVDDRVVTEVEAEPAKFLGNCRAQQAKLASLGPNFARDEAVCIPLICVGLDLFGNKLADRRAEGLMIFVINGAVQCIERHGRILLMLFWQPETASLRKRQAGI